MKPIYTTQSSAEAGLIQAILRDHGIDSVLDNASAPIPTAAPLTVQVTDSDEELALRLIREHLAKSA
jgi:hypothetical protein